MGYAIFFAIFLVAVLLFVAFFIPSERAALDKDMDNLDFQGNWKPYLIAFICTTLAIAILHLLLEERAYFQLSDIYFYVAPLLAVSPGARRTYRAMRDFVLRR